MHVIISDRQHVEAARAAIFSLFLESHDAFKASGCQFFPENACTR